MFNFTRIAWAGLAVGFGLISSCTTPRVDRFVEEDLGRALGQGRALAIVTLQGPAQLEYAETRLDARRRLVAPVQERVLSSLEPSEFELIHRYEFVAGLSGWLTPEGLQVLRRHPDVVAVQLDRSGGGNTAESVPQISAEEWAQVGITGDGVVVAVLDSGLVDHPDLADDLLFESCILGDQTAAGGIPCPDGSGEQLDEPGAALDGHGHGTNVTGIITSRGTVAPPGVAPGAEFLAIKILDDSNAGRTGDLIEGLNHLIDLLADFDVRVVNISAGWNVPLGECNRGIGAMTGLLVTILQENGVLVVAGSGNDGDRQQMDFPACVNGVFSVGAVNEDDILASFTDVSPKLDVVAPGRNVTSTGITQTGVLTLTGTSQAAPHVSACAALRLDDDPTLTPAELKQILRLTSVFVTDENTGLSIPRLFCGRPVLM